MPAPQKTVAGLIGRGMNKGHGKPELSLIGVSNREKGPQAWPPSSKDKCTETPRTPPSEGEAPALAHLATRGVDSPRRGVKAPSFRESPSLWGIIRNSS